MKIEHEVWKIITPVESTNYVLNPSGEIAGNFSALGTATVARSTTYQLYGVYSYSVQTGANAAGITLTTGTLTNAAHSVSFRVRGRLPNNLRVILGESIKQPELVENINNDWDLYAAYFDANAANGRTEVRIIQQGNGLGNFYLDGVQVEALAYWTTYIDGSQEGCNWNGAEHAASSTRSSKSKDGGRVVDLYKEYNFFVTGNVGAGMPPQELGIDSYALLPGGELDSTKIFSRTFTLVGKFIADSEGELYTNRQALIKLLRKDNRNQQLKWLVYHPNEIREIKAVYSGGLEGDAPIYYENEFIAVENNQWAEVETFVEPAAIQLVATDPYFYGVGNEAVTLDTLDSSTFRSVAGRLKSTGQWDVLGPPNAAGSYDFVFEIVEDETYVYICGTFLNFDNIANADRIARYHKQTGAWSALGTGMNGQVSTIALGPDGTLYAGGDFTTAGGTAAARIAKWNGSAWSALSTGANGSVNALTVGLDGILYAGGDFTSPATRVAAWNGIGWSGLTSGANANVSALAIDPTTGYLYVGGSFTVAGGVGNTAYIAYWDGSAWHAMSTGMDALVATLAFSSDGILYAGGSFTVAGTISASRIASWNGGSFSALGDGVTGGDVAYLQVGADGVLYVGGAFTTAGDLALNDGIARWNGSSWSHVDIDLPGSPTVNSLLASKFVDKILNHKYDLYLGFNTTGTGYFCGKVTATNNGSSDAFPKIFFNRNGGTTATIQSLRNESTGKELLFDYDLLDGETLTINLNPVNKTVISDYLGNKLDAVLSNSDFGDWVLEPDSNVITCFVTNPNVVIYPSEITAWLEWKKVFESYD